MSFFVKQLYLEYLKFDFDNLSNSLRILVVFFCEATLFNVCKVFICFVIYLKGLSNQLHLAPLGPQYGALDTTTTTTGPDIAVISA